MAKILIENINGGSLIFPSNSLIATVQSAVQKQTLNAEDIVELTILSMSKIDFPINAFIRVNSKVYKLNKSANETKANGQYTYTLTLESPQYDLLKAVMLDLDESGNLFGTQFSYVGDLQAHLVLLLRSAAEFFGPNVWSLGVCPNTEAKEINYSDENCLSALQRLMRDFNQEFEIVSNPAGTAHVLAIQQSGLTHTTVFKYGAGKGLNELQRNALDDSNIVTRLYAYGSDKNLGASYRSGSIRLKLPISSIPAENKNYIQDDIAAAKYGKIGAAKTFDDIYPKFTGHLTALNGDVYTFTDETITFDLNAKNEAGNTIYVLPGTTPKVKFTSGALNGYTFEILSYVHATKTFKIKKFTDARGLDFPNENSTAFQAQVGDSYIFTDIQPDPQRIIDAEQELLKRAQQYLAENSKPKVEYVISFDELFLKSRYSKTDDIFKAGDFIPIEDADLKLSGLIRVQSVTRDLLRPFQYSLKLSEVKSASLITRVTAAVLEHDRILSINKLKDFERVRLNWRTTNELKDLIFDADNYFNPENIKPNSIETSMLVVAAKSAQFVLDDVGFYPNYKGDKNKIYATAGKLVHYGISEQFKTWHIAETGIQTIADNNSRYIYARCSQTTTDGIIIFDTAQRKVDEDPNYYYFLIGVLHSVINDIRAISLTYGFSAINGRFLTTGRIQSADGLSWWDLDQGFMNIRGKVTIVGDGSNVYTKDEAKQITDQITDQITEQLDNLASTWELIPVSDKGVHAFNYDLTGALNTLVYSVKFMRAGKDVTAIMQQSGLSLYNFERKNTYGFDDNNVSDASWNAAHVGAKTVTLTDKDIYAVGSIEVVYNETILENEYQKLIKNG